MSFFERAAGTCAALARRDADLAIGGVCAPDHSPLIVPLPVTDLVTREGLPV